MITRGILEFMARDWAAARRLKDAYWGDPIARLGPLEGLRGQWARPSGRANIR